MSRSNGGGRGFSSYPPAAASSSPKLLPVGGAVYREALLRAKGFAVARVSAAEWRALGGGGSGRRGGGGGGGRRGGGRFAPSSSSDPAAARVAAEDAFVARLMARAAIEG
jgi:hypothetical protein